MNQRQIENLIESRGLNWEDVAALSPTQRFRADLPLIIPQVDYGPIRRVAENYLPQFGLLRRLFGLDQLPQINPSFEPGDAEIGRAHSWYQSQVQFLLDRTSVYQLSDEMDGHPVLSGALHLYAEEATQNDREEGRSIWFESPNEQVKTELMNMLDRLRIEDRLPTMVRSMCKYGDNFQKVITAQDEGVVALKYIQPYRLTRIEDKHGILRGFAAGVVRDHEKIADMAERGDVQISQPWEFLHFRIPSSHEETIHGEPLIFGVRRAYRMLSILEDMMVVYRINRAGDKDVHYVNVQGSTPEQKFQALHKWAQYLRKKLFFSEATGKSRQQFNPRSVDEDLFVPVSGKDDGTRVERLSGAGPVGDIFDIYHVVRTLCGGLRIPPGFLGFEQDINAKATLTVQDLRFARTMMRVQRSIKHGFTYLGMIHLAKKEMDPLAVENAFKVRMAAVNHLADMASLEAWQIKNEVANALIEFGQLAGIPNLDRWTTYVLREVLGLDYELIEELMTEPEGGSIIIPPAEREIRAKAQADAMLTAQQADHDQEQAHIDAHHDKQIAVAKEKAKPRPKPPAKKKPKKEGDEPPMGLLRQALGSMLPALQQRTKLLNEAGEVISEVRAEEARDAKVFDPLPAKDKELEQPLFDLEEEEQALLRTIQEARQKRETKISCPRCREGLLEHRVGDRKGSPVMLSCKACGFDHPIELGRTG